MTQDPWNIEREPPGSQDLGRLICVVTTDVVSYILYVTACRHVDLCVHLGALSVNTLQHTLDTQIHITWSPRCIIDISREGTASNWAKKNTWNGDRLRLAAVALVCYVITLQAPTVCHKYQFVVFVLNHSLFSPLLLPISCWLLICPLISLRSVARRCTVPLNPRHPSLPRQP